MNRPLSHFRHESAKTRVRVMPAEKLAGHSGVVLLTAAVIALLAISTLRSNGSTPADQRAEGRLQRIPFRSAKAVPVDRRPQYSNFNNRSHSAPQRAPKRAGQHGSECAGLRHRVAPSRVFSELQSSARRLVALDPMSKRLKRVLVAKRSPSRHRHHSAIPIGAGRGAI